MNLKYYLRGLGIGVLVTAFIMGVTGKEKPMTDAEIKIRAAKLGMVEETVLSDLKTEDAEENGTTDGVISEESEVEQETVQEPTQGTEEEKESSEESASKEETVVQANGVVTTEANYVIITIDGGNASNTVSNKLFEAGLIESSADYNQYLISNGYDRKLRAGDHRIPLDATEEQIARIICGME